MKWRILRSECDPHEEFLKQQEAARAPYAEAWKKFDKLQKDVKRRGGSWWIHLLMGDALPLLGGGAFGVALWKNHKPYVVVAVAALILWGIFKAISDRREFAEWRCPRCHSIWPGTKTEKDSRCKVCGLRLHQLAP
jgi:hypothetical protein